MTSLATLLRATLPEDADKAALAGRIWRPDVNGPAVVAIRGGQVFDISDIAPTMRDLCETPDPAGTLRSAQGSPVGPLDAVLDNTPPEQRDTTRPWLLAPIDLQAIKAAGVT
ncbi:MAG TPA: fumarylacetoacetate hydrolase, partial [Rhodopila sp.]|nr:fumarylacetoacetate hydrolase [Rhodopila sp.]